MANVFRGPLVTRIWSRSATVAILAMGAGAVAGSLLLTTLKGQDRVYGGPGLVPEYDYQNPRGPQYPVSLRSWLQVGDRPQGAALPVVVGQYDWPNPKGYTPLNKSWEASYNNPLNFVTPSLPFLNYDWPNPLVARNDRAVGSQPPSTLSLPQLTASPVVSVFDWQNPTLSRQRFDLRTWVSFGIKEVAAPPFSQLDWPNPLVVRNDRALTTQSIQSLSIHHVYFNALGGASIIRRLPPRPSHEFGFVQSTPIAIKPVSVPFSNRDFQNPYLIRRAHQPRIYARPPIIFVIPSPFCQVDWPNPIILRPRPEYVQPQPLVFRSSGLKPFAQYDWPLPTRLAPSASDLNLCYSLQLVKRLGYLTGSFLESADVFVGYINHLWGPVTPTTGVWTPTTDDTTLWTPDTLASGSWVKVSRDS